jgi:pantoate--beta-alanine ligase
MQILGSIQEMRAASKALHRQSNPESLGFVPTMGALHEGHLSLIREAKRRCDRVAASIFVNPLQFDPNEDFARYPRTFEEDCNRLFSEGVDLVFAPNAQEMYPVGAETYVEVPNIGSRLDGASRPGHFRGVATVVAKLFHIVQPDIAFFGQKDAAQVAVLRAMVRDLNFDVEIVVCPTVREDDGLAMSSRNRNLEADEREHALTLSQSLRNIQHAISCGEDDAWALRGSLLHELGAAEGVRLDYAEIVDPHTLEPLREVRPGALAAVAAYVGSTRLIDNAILRPEDSGATK